MGKDKRKSEMTVDEKIMVFIVMASELFKKKSSAIFKQCGLTFSHYNVLKYLVGCEGGRDTVGNVSKRMLVTGANVTGLAKRMEKAGMIERKNDAKDERLTMLEITPLGRKSFDAIWEIQERHVSDYLHPYSEERKKDLLDLLRHVIRTGKHLDESKY